MKIVYISYATIPSRTANSIQVMKMCQAMALNGHKVVLLVPDKKSESEKGISDIYHFYGVKNCFEIRKIFCPLIKEKTLIFSFRATYIAKKLKSDIIYTRSILAGLVASFYGVPTICEYHQSIDHVIDSLFFRILIRSTMLKRFVVVSHALKGYYEKKFPWVKSRISVFPDGADPVAKDIVPVKIRNPGNKFLVGYAGHLYKGKGIEIISKLAQLCPWAEFHIIGGMPEDVLYWQKRLIKFKNIILYGFIPHREIYRYLLSFDALVAPYQEQVSVYDGWKKIGGSGDVAKWMSPLKVFEYMYAGKAIIASDLPVLKEVLKNERNALLVPPDDVKLWERALIRVRDDLGLRKQLGQQAKIDIEENNNWEKRAKQIFTGI
jgi:glycosyltransferase involved in cell wall biosynthesis